jgi:hypothetical protein
MNFSYMIILLFTIMLYIIFKTKPKSYIVLLYITILLILNEIYNYKDYNRDTFASPTEPVVTENLQDSDYYYNKTINPQDYLDLLSMDELQQYKIPVEYNTQLEGSMSCVGQDKLLNLINQRDKLKSQDLYMNKFYDYFSKGSLNLDEGDSNKSVFDPIEIDNTLKKLKCPTTCHLISDEEGCRNALDIPVFNGYTPQKQNEEYNKYINETNKCKKKKEDACGTSKECYWDGDFKECYYDKRKCFYRKKQNNYDNDSTPQCYTRCEFLNIPQEDGETDSQLQERLKKSKARCENATDYYDTNVKNCEWTTDVCITKDCNKYETKRECKSDSSCIVYNDLCVNGSMMDS